MDSDVAFATSNLPSLDEELPDGTTTFTTARLETDLAALQLDVLSKPLTDLPCSHTTVEVSKASTVALQPQSEPQRQQSQPLASELARYDSALSMRSLLTESTFSIGTTIDSCPPSPTLSAHVAKPPHRGSWSSNPYQMPGALCRVNTWPTLRTGGQKSSTSPVFYFAESHSSEDGSSHSASESGSKDSSTFSSRSSVHEFSRFTDEDSEQSRSIRDDRYDLLIEAICNVVSNHFSENDLRRLKTPITYYANVFLEQIARDIGDSNILSTTPVIYQTYGPSEDAPTASFTKPSSPGSTGEHGGKRKMQFEQNDFDGDDGDGDDPRPPVRMDGREVSKRARGNEGALSCPFRKRNPIRFNVRSHSSCALSDFPSMSHLKRHIKTFHSTSGEECRQCGAWFGTLEDLNRHSARPMGCEPGHAGDRNREDGIGQTDLQNLYDEKVETWKDLWAILFPDLNRDIPCPGFDPPVELDEVETQFYGAGSVDDLSNVFQQIALSPRSISPCQLSQQALNKSAGFICSTLKSCRDTHGHTFSFSREARDREFLERVQNLRFQPPLVQNLDSTTPCIQTQPNPRYSRESHDSGIASFIESDIDLDMPWEPNHGCSDLGKAALLSAGSMALSSEGDVLQFGPLFDSPGPAITSNLASTTTCFCQGTCSLCHVANCEPVEAHVGQWPKHSTGRANVFSTPVDAHLFDEAHDTEATDSWTLHDTRQKHLGQTHNLISANVDPGTPSTQPSTPHYPYSDAHSVSAEEDTELQYERLVESITNLVVKSNLIEHLDDDSVPIFQHTHAYLENIQNHEDISDAAGKLHVSSSSFCTDGNDPGPSMGDNDASGSANGIRKRKQGGGHEKRRRKDDDGDENPNGNGPEDFEDPEDCSGDKKRARVDGRQRFPCPYRTRHTTRFNVRSHPQCALNTFESMALLKRHIKFFHMSDTQGPRCVRCQRCFQTSADLREHLLQANFCEIRSIQGELQDPEDGLSAEMYESLTKRSKSEKIDTWDALWRFLFPLDESVPSPHYEEPIELDELQENCYNEQIFARFFQKPSHHTHKDGFLYIVKTFKKIRKAFNHNYSEQRKQQDEKFLQAVRKRASSSHGASFSHPSSSWPAQTAGSNFLNSYNHPDEVSSHVWSSGIGSVPDMTNGSPSTIMSSNDARNSNHALTPPSSWQFTAGTSEKPGTATFASNVLGSSNEDPYYRQQDNTIKRSEITSLQEQAIIQDDQMEHSQQQDTSISGFCQHHLEVEKYCEQCAEESLSSFFEQEEFDTSFVQEVVGGMAAY